MASATKRALSPEEMAFKIREMNKLSPGGGSPWTSPLSIEFGGPQSPAGGAVSPHSQLMEHVGPNGEITVGNVWDDEVRDVAMGQRHPQPFPFHEQEQKQEEEEVDEPLADGFGCALFSPRCSGSHEDMRGDVLSVGGDNDLVRGHSQQLQPPAAPMTPVDMFSPTHITSPMEIESGASPGSPHSIVLNPDPFPAAEPFSPHSIATEGVVDDAQDPLVSPPMSPCCSMLSGQEPLGSAPPDYAAKNPVTSPVAIAEEPTSPSSAIEEEPTSPDHVEESTPSTSIVEENTSPRATVEDVTSPMSIEVTDVEFLSPASMASDREEPETPASMAAAQEEPDTPAAMASAQEEPETPASAGSTSSKVSNESRVNSVKSLLEDSSEDEDSDEEEEVQDGIDDDEEDEEQEEQDEEDELDEQGEPEDLLELEEEEESEESEVDEDEDSIVAMERRARKAELKRIAAEKRLAARKIELAAKKKAKAEAAEKAARAKAKAEALKKAKVKRRKKVSFIETNPTPLSPLSVDEDDAFSPKSHNSMSESMLSPRNDDEETLTLDDEDWCDERTWDDETDDRRETLLSRAKRRSRAGITPRHRDGPSPASGYSHPSTINVPDDESEASLMVLMRYMGCTPIAYGDGATLPRGAQWLDEGDTPTGREFVFDSFDDDNSILSDDDTYSTYASRASQMDLRPVGTFKEEEGVEMGLDDWVPMSPKSINSALSPKSSKSASSRKSSKLASSRKSKESAVSPTSLSSRKSSKSASSRKSAKSASSRKSSSSIMSPKDEITEITIKKVVKAKKVKKTDEGEEGGAMMEVKKTTKKKPNLTVDTESVSNRNSRRKGKGKRSQKVTDTYSVLSDTEDVSDEELESDNERPVNAVFFSGGESDDESNLEEGKILKKKSKKATFKEPRKRTSLKQKKAAKKSKECVPSDDETALSTGEEGNEIETDQESNDQSDGEEVVRKGENKTAMKMARIRSGTKGKGSKLSKKSTSSRKEGEKVSRKSAAVKNSTKVIDNDDQVEEREVTIKPKRTTAKPTSSADALKKYKAKAGSTPRGGSTRSSPEEVEEIDKDARRAATEAFKKKLSLDVPSEGGALERYRKEASTPKSSEKRSSAGTSEKETVASPSSRTEQEKVAATLLNKKTPSEKKTKVVVSDIENVALEMKTKSTKKKKGTTSSKSTSKRKKKKKAVKPKKEDPQEQVTPVDENQHLSASTKSGSSKKEPPLTSIKSKTNAAPIQAQDRMAHRNAVDASDGIIGSYLISPQAGCNTSWEDKVSVISGFSETAMSPAVRQLASALSPRNPPRLVDARVKSPGAVDAAPTKDLMATVDENQPRHDNKAMPNVSGSGELESVSNAATAMVAAALAAAEASIAQTTLMSPKNKASVTPFKPVSPSDDAPPMKENKVDDVETQDVAKLRESPSNRSDKENSGSETSVPTPVPKESPPLTVDTSAAPTTSQERSVREVDALLSKTRKWLVRHNETQLQNDKTPSTAAPSAVTGERKVMENITSKAVRNPENSSGKRLLGGKDSSGKPSSSSLMDQLMLAKGGRVGGASVPVTSAASILSSASSSSLSAPTAPKKSIMEQLGEIRAKQRELEKRQKTKLTKV